MNEFEEKLNAILGDPAEMERITRLASELMGGGDLSAPSAQPRLEDTVPPIADGELLRKITKLLGSGGVTGTDKTPLLQAMAPYLKPARQAKLQKALRMAKMAKLARAALEEYGGENRSV